MRQKPPPFTSGTERRKRLLSTQLSDFIFPRLLRHQQGFEWTLKKLDVLRLCGL
jgi:hypothetical protein